MRTYGHYRSELIESVDWHAGVRMVDRHYSFIRFFPGHRWLRAEHRSVDLDFDGFLAALDLDNIFATMDRVDPPTSVERDGGYLYQAGTYSLDGDTATFSFHSAIAGMSITFSYTSSSDGATLTGPQDAVYHHVAA